MRAAINLGNAVLAGRNAEGCYLVRADSPLHGNEEVDRVGRTPGRATAAPATST